MPVQTAAPSNLFDFAEPAKPTSPNPFDQESEEEEEEEEKPASPNPFDNPQPEPMATSSMFDFASQQKPSSPVSSSNMFDFASQQPAAPSNLFDFAEPAKPTSPNPFDQNSEEEEEKPTSSNPFAEPLHSDVPAVSPSASTQPQSFDFFENASSQTSQTDMLATSSADFASFTQEAASQEPLDSSFSAAAPSEPAAAEPTYDLSFLSDSKPKEEEPKEKKSLWKSFKTRQKKNDDVIIEGLSEEPKKKWGLSEKQKGTLKSGMGKFSSLLKTAAVKGQQAFKSHNEEPAEFPDFDVR